MKVADGQLPGYTGYSPKHPHARGEDLTAEETKVEHAQGIIKPKQVSASENYHRQVRPNHDFAVRLSKSSVQIGSGF